MKFKVVILDQDQNYQNRLLVALREKYSNVVDVIPCNNLSEILKVIETHEPDLFVINERIDFDFSVIPEECAVACFTEFRMAGKVKDKPSICKYQKVGDISSEFGEIAMDYQKVLKVKREEEAKAEEERLKIEQQEEEQRLERERKEEEERLEKERQEEEERQLKEEEERREVEQREEEERKRLEEEEKAEQERITNRRKSPKLVVFLSAQDGNGSATATAACAMNAIDRDLNVFQINLRPFKNTGNFFIDTENKLKIMEFVNLINHGKLNVEDFAKMVSIDETGVDYIVSGDEAVMLAELQKNGIQNLLSILAETVNYDAIVINIEYSLNPVTLEILKAASEIVVVGSGYAESNVRIQSYIDTLKGYDEINETTIAEKISILYNKFVNRKCTMLSIPGISVIGGVNNVDGTIQRERSKNMAKMIIFKQLISE